VLQSYRYRIPLGDLEFEPIATAVRTLAARLIRLEPRLRGLKVAQDEGFVDLTIRVAGNTRWDISHDAKKLIIRLTRAARIRTDTVKLAQVVTEINGRQLYLGEGRTEMTRTPRSQRQDRWNEYEWWGDDLSVAEDGDNHGVG
jgi:hypothetical protein